MHVEPTSLAPSRPRRAIAGLFLGLFFALHLTIAFPALHHAWHANPTHHADNPADCEDPDCVVDALARGAVDPTVALQALIPPTPIELRASSPPPPPPVLRRDGRLSFGRAPPLTHA